MQDRAAGAKAGRRCRAAYSLQGLPPMPYDPSTGSTAFIPRHRDPGMIMSVVLALRNARTAAAQAFCSSIICNGAGKNWNPSPCLATCPIPGHGKW